MIARTCDGLQDGRTAAMRAGAARGGGIGSAAARMIASTIRRSCSRSMGSPVRLHQLGDALFPAVIARVAAPAHVDRPARDAAIVCPLVQTDRLEPRELEDREERRDDQRA